MKVRFIFQDICYAMTINVGGSPDVRMKTFEYDIPGIENVLISGNPGESRNFIGVEFVEADHES